MRAPKGVRDVSLALLSGVLIAAGNVWIGWCAYIAFAGGTLPIPGVDMTTEGAVYPGVMFLLFGVPIVSGAAYLVAKAIHIPLALIASAVAALARSIHRAHPRKEDSE